LLKVGRPRHQSSMDDNGLHRAPAQTRAPREVPPHPSDPPSCSATAHIDHPITASRTLLPDTGGDCVMRWRRPRSRRHGSPAIGHSGNADSHRRCAQNRHSGRRATNRGARWPDRRPVPAGRTSALREHATKDYAVRDVSAWG
jgi:hypothetical protein